MSEQQERLRELVKSLGVPARVVSDPPEPSPGLQRLRELEARDAKRRGAYRQALQEMVREKLQAWLKAAGLEPPAEPKADTPIEVKP